MAILLGLLVALSYGAGDFLGGLSSRRLDAVAVVQVSQACGLVALLLTVLVPGQELLAADALRGAAAGSVGLVGVALLYRGLARGAMAIVAPITAVGAAVLPVVWGLLDGERPGTTALVGAAIALVAIGLVSSPQDGGEALEGRGREVTLTLVAGAAFGVVFILLGGTSDDSGLWPVLVMRVASVSLVTLALLARGRAPRLPPPGTRALVATAGILDVSANGLFVFAAREGLLSTVSVVSSLYPAATVVLAAALLHEHPDRRQRVGLVAALLGVFLIAL